MIYGIDEAGRGCVIGPLVMCRAGIEKGQERELHKLGVKDSKKLSATQREALEGPVREMCDIRTHHISAKDITKKMDELNLNDIEAETIGQLLSDVSADSQVFIDSPDNVPIKFAARIKRFLKPAPYLVCENKAEDRYPIVAAASIIAKLERDREIERIKKEVGHDFNSGYTSDPITIAFLARHVDDKKVKQYIRWKWATLENLRQRKMSDY
ncbi:MAG: ribonuclease HII [Candidatus Marsarchaeota archaeon]|nr:ribonuclease HII [Candidatus Marsarchaeota archaeon]